MGRKHSGYSTLNVSAKAKGSTCKWESSPLLSRGHVVQMIYQHFKPKNQKRKHSFALEQEPQIIQWMTLFAVEAEELLEAGLDYETVRAMEHLLG